MDILLKKENNKEEKKSEIKNTNKEINQEKSCLNNNININNLTRLKTYTNYKINKNIFNNQIDVNNKDIITTSRQTNNNKIKFNQNENKNKNLFLLKYEDYKARIKRINKCMNLTSRENKSKINFNNSCENRGKSNLNKEFISVEKMFKKYNSKEWDQIYIKRFKSYQENINKKREDIRKIKEKEKKQKEDEIINYSNKKRKLTSNEYNNYRPLFIRSKYNNKNQEQKPNNKIIKKKNLFNKCNKRDNIYNNNIYNNRYIDEDLQNIKNNNIIYYKGNIYDLEEERKTLISMSKRINVSKSIEFRNNNFLNEYDKNHIKYNNTNYYNEITETDKLIYEFVIRHLEEN